MMKMLRAGVTTTLLFGLLYALAPQAPPKAPQKTPAAGAPAAVEEQVSPEEKKKRKDWALSMHKKAPPKKGCFSAAYPKTDWEEVPCAPMRNIPMVPRHGPRPFTVGNDNDVSAGAPTGFISQVIGHFENITNVTNESGPIGNTGPSIADAYTLQINTNNFTSTVCAGSANPACQGWQQFVYENTGSPFGSRLHPVLDHRVRRELSRGPGLAPNPALWRNLLLEEQQRRACASAQPADHQHRHLDL